MGKNIDKRLWGVLGKQQTFYSPQKQVEGKTKTPLNASAFDSWDAKRSRFRRVDGYDVSDAAQQGGTVIGQDTTPVVSPTPSTTPQPTPTNTPTPSITPTITPTPSCAGYAITVFTASGSTPEELCCNPQPVGSLYSPQPFFTDGQQLYSDVCLNQYIDYNTNPMWLSTGGTQLYAYVYAGLGLTTYGIPCSSIDCNSYWNTNTTDWNDETSNWESI